MAKIYDFGTELDVISSMTESLPTHRSWTKDALVSKSGRRCLVGSIVGDNHEAFQQLSDHSAIDILADVALEQFPDRASHSNKAKPRTSMEQVIYFNDHPKTSFTDVRVILEKGLVKAAEKIC